MQNPQTNNLSVPNIQITEKKPPWGPQNLPPNYERPAKKIVLPFQEGKETPEQYHHRAHAENSFNFAHGYLEDAPKGNLVTKEDSEKAFSHHFPGVKRYSERKRQIDGRANERKSASIITTKSNSVSSKKN